MSETSTKKLRRPTLKESKFIRVIKSGSANSYKEAARIAGYRGVSLERTGEILNRPAVNTRLKDFIEGGDLIPLAEEALRDIFMLPVDGYDTAQDKVAILKLKLEVVKEINKIQGNYAPTKTENKSAIINFKDPFSSDSE